MNTPRFFISKLNISDDNFVLDNLEDLNKIKNVLRLQPGDKLELLGEDQTLYGAEIDKLTQKAITGSIISKEKMKKTTPKVELTLAQSLPKASKMDDIVRMNTEIGVNKFIPFESQNSVLRLKTFNPKKLERWRKIAKEATRQSERPQIPQISNPKKFEDLLELDADLKILLHSRKTEKVIDINQVLKICDIKKVKSILLLVGPEGGFASKELEMAQENKFHICFMNFPILRTETAGIAANSIIFNTYNN